MVYGRTSKVAAALLLVTLSASWGDRSEARERSTTIAPGVVAASAPHDDRRLIVAFGDSLYAGYGLTHGEGLAPALERELDARGVAATVLNRSVSGSPSSAGRTRLAETLDGLDRPPALVLVGFGSVDMLQGASPDSLRENLAAILDKLRERGIPAMLTGMRNGPGFGDDSWRAYEPVYLELADEYGVPLYPFLLEGVAGDPALVLRDRIHPSADGATRIAANIAGQVAGALPDGREGPQTDGAVQ